MECFARGIKGYEQRQFRVVCSTVAVGLVLLSELSLVKPQIQSVYVCQKRERAVCEEFQLERRWGILDFCQSDIIKNTSSSVAVHSHSSPHDSHTSRKYICFSWVDTAFDRCGMTSLDLEVWSGHVWIDSTAFWCHMHSAQKHVANTHTHPAPYVAWGSFRAILLFLFSLALFLSI